jgi:succinate-semialdehyde dehydrogenase/glutarate-semialdehyde dehydrogenase
MDVAIDMEIFGPTFPIIPFDTEEEAIAIANQTRYGLSSGIITRDLKRALRMAPRIEAGSVVLNGSSSYRTWNRPSAVTK